MSRRTMLFGAILCLVAMVFFVSWPVWKWFKFKPVSASLYERTKAAGRSFAERKATRQAS